MKYGFGADVGGTTVKLGFFSHMGDLLEKWEIPTRTIKNGEHILPDIAEALEDCLERHGVSKEDVIGIGIGVPGPVSDEGVVNRCVNLGWGVFNVKETLSGLMGGIRVSVGNDANVAALGEQWLGGGKGFSNVV
ncbi:MAG: ROK family protein, partial [Oscillospiraceae bacterium]|nr:ROK family protein [Oscillospiraceae bacterium]